MNTALFLDISARGHPDRVLASDGFQSATYSQVLAAANKVANGLMENGIVAGDRVAICCPNRIAFIIAYYGILKVGATAVVLSIGLKDRDLCAQLIDSQCRGLFCFDGFDGADFVEMAEAAAARSGCRYVWILPRNLSLLSAPGKRPTIGDLMEGRSSVFQTRTTDPHSTAVIPYTSGTTGYPKGVEITHSNISSIALSTLSLGDWIDSQTRLIATPLCHIMAQVTGLAIPVLCAQTLILVERYEPEAVWGRMLREAVSYVAGPPPLFSAILGQASQHDPSAIRRTLRVCATGAAPLPDMLSQQFRDVFGIPLLQGYGASETTSVVAWNCSEDDNRPGTVGRPIPGTEVRIVAENGGEQQAGECGQIAVRGPGIMKGYINRRDETSKVLRNGWYLTGDLGRQDHDGYLTWIGRMDDVIVRWTGTNVSPNEIENLIATFPSVAAAAVVGRHKEQIGEAVVAVVAPKTGTVFDESAFRAWLSQELPDNLMPDAIELRAHLPLNEMGKVDRRSLRLPSAW